MMSSFWPDAFAISATPYVGLHSGDRPRKTPVASGTAQVGVTVPGYRCHGNYLITWAYSRRSVEVNGSGRNTGQSDKGSKSCRGQHQITPDERPRVRRSAGWRGWHSTRCFGGASGAMRVGRSGVVGLPRNQHPRPGATVRRVALAGGTRWGTMVFSITLGTFPSIIANQHIPLH